VDPVTDLMPEQAVDLDEMWDEEQAEPAGKGLDAVDEQPIARLAGKARDGGLQLTGEGGLLVSSRTSTSAVSGACIPAPVGPGVDPEPVRGDPVARAGDGHR
jgi:hypothetical protein